MQRCRDGDVREKGCGMADFSTSCVLTVLFHCGQNTGVARL